MTPHALRRIDVPTADTTARVTASLLAPAGTPSGVYAYGPLTVLLTAPLHVPSWLPDPERRRRYAAPFAELDALDVDPAFDALARQLHGDGVRWAASVNVYLDDPLFRGRVALAFRGKRLVGIVAPRRVGGVK